ncbi:MAG TPA: Wzz/FepE/Etk N-terminal domain-containing protein [Terriglobia bacterium]|nr:Wzz/FepE/Etk N-terminal domain-containing protein [Terriglobia bacterium]
MSSSIGPNKASRSASRLPAPEAAGMGNLTPEHYLLILKHRKWFILIVFLLVSTGTMIVSQLLPDIYTSQTVILVDPQQVPPDYVKPTVTGEVRDRLSTLSQQIMSATRLQIIIDKFNLYAEQRRTRPMEEVIDRMRRDTSVQIVSEFGGAPSRRNQDMQGFRISYSGTDPRLVAQVTNELASLFIEENLKARERTALGTTDFMQEQLIETERNLRELETKLRDFKLKHVGEMPDQQNANLQILGQLQSRLQIIVDAQNRAQQQRSYLQALLDSQREAAAAASATASDGSETAVAPAEGANARELQYERRLAELTSRYGPNHPDVLRVKRELEETREINRKEAEQALSARTLPVLASARPGAPAATTASTLEAQIAALDEEIALQKRSQAEVEKSIADYQRRVETVPIREQEMADLVRQYDMSKKHYSDLLAKKLAAEEAAQLEVRQKGEKFMILDPAQVPEKPSRPNRLMINAVGSAAGLALGLALALATEFLGFSITISQQVLAATGVPVLGVIPIIYTRADKIRRKRLALAGAATAIVVALVAGVLVAYHFQLVRF